VSIRVQVLALCCVFSAVYSGCARSESVDNPILLELKPRVCTMTTEEERCVATIRAHWKSSRNESLCLVIVGRPDIKRCWENFSNGRYNIELEFADDLTVQLRDLSLEKVLASAAITVIREAMQLRRKRKQPWNLFSRTTELLRRAGVV
jgi:hypothetical protein